jgi:1,2-dihydroxy-3-keto-5-methylthiopentene dioxygenase
VTTVRHFTSKTTHHQPTTMLFASSSSLFTSTTTAVVLFLFSFLLLSDKNVVVVVVGETEVECINGVPLPADFDGTDWPTLYRLSSSSDSDSDSSDMEMEEDDDPMLPNEGEEVDPSVLAMAGITYQYMDPTGFDYPNATAEIPWLPSADDGSNNDMLLQDIRDKQDYQYADIIVVTDFIPTFYDEHSHDDTTVRYILDGSGYFDLRDVNDEWVRMYVTAGDFLEWPKGIEHRFTVTSDESYIQAMRLYKGSSTPDWSAIPRSFSEQYGNNTARNDYVSTYLCGNTPYVNNVEEEEEEEDDDHDEDHGHDHDDMMNVPKDSGSLSFFFSFNSILSSIIIVGGGTMLLI